MVEQKQISVRRVEILDSCKIFPRKGEGEEKEEDEEGGEREEKKRKSERSRDRIIK